MSLSHQALRTPPTRDEVLDVLLSVLALLGFETSSWQDGSIQRTVFTTVASVGADFAKLGSKIAGFGFNSYATGAPLREYSRSSYDNEPQPAQKTVGPCKLVSTAAVPYAVQVGQLIGATENGVEFGNTTAGTIPAGGSLDTLVFEAKLAGASGNVANNAIKVLKTPLAGVTISNPPGGNGVWYTTSGADPEQVAKLRTRNRTRWGTLNQIAMPSDGFRNLALSIPAITKVYVDDQNPRGPYTLDVYVATSTGPATPTELAAVQSLLNIKKGPTTNVLVLAPTNKVVTVTATIHIQASLNTAAKQAAIRAAIDAFVQALPLGGIILPPSTTRIIPKSELFGAITAIKGVVGVQITTPAGDETMNPIDLATNGVHQLQFLSA
jgi:uncharacterized phage protein gp47/JayE